MEEESTAADTPQSSEALISGDLTAKELENIKHQKAVYLFVTDLLYKLYKKTDIEYDPAVFNDINLRLCTQLWDKLKDADIEKKNVKSLNKAVYDALIDHWVSPKTVLQNLISQNYMCDDSINDAVYNHLTSLTGPSLSTRFFYWFRQICRCSLVQTGEYIL